MSEFQQEVIPVEPTQPQEQPLSGELPKQEVVPEESKAEPEVEAKEEPKPKKSIEEALKGAFEKGEKLAKEKADAKAAKEQPEKGEEKAEAKEEQPEEAKPAQQRSQDGKFARAEQEQEQPKRPTAFKEAPQRFDDEAKREWDAVPESVRGNITRMQRELEGGIQKYRQSAEEYESVREYADMARQYGTSLRQALDNYVGIESMLRQNPLQGLEQIVANLGLKDGQGQPLTFRALAMAVAGQKPEQVSAQQDRTISELRQQVQQLTQQLGGVTQHFQQQQEQARVQNAEGAWELFVRENPRAAALEAEIASVLQQYPTRDNISLKDRLADAFAIASARNPEAAHTGEPVLAQTQEPRQPNPDGRKSISGAAATGTLTPSAKPKKPPSIEESLKNAARRAGMSI